MSIKFAIKNRWTGAVQFEAEIEADEHGDAFTAGRLAYAAGKRHADNPYYEAGILWGDQSGPAIAWGEGWDEEWKLHRSAA